MPWFDSSTGKRPARNATARCSLATLLCLLILAPGLAWSSPRETYGDIQGVVFRRATAPDVFIADLPGLPAVAGRQMEVRIRGLEAPAILGRCAREKRLAEQGRQVIELLLSRARQITLRDVGRDHTFRLQAIVLVDGQNLGLILVKKHLARWSGGPGPRVDWCAP